MSTRAWYQTKAECCVRAWRRMYDVEPSAHAVIMLCAVASLETCCGDDVGKLPLPYNWGAIQRRSPTEAERALSQAGGKPVPKDPFEQLHIDTHPGGRVYLAWFYKFPPDAIYPASGLSGHEAAAWMLIKVIMGQEPETKAIADTITATQLATNMRNHGYYEGIYAKGTLYPPPSWYHGPVQPDGKVDGTTLCIASYAGGIQNNQRGFDAALVGWNPSSTPALSEETQHRIDELIALTFMTSLDEGYQNRWGRVPQEDDAA